MLGVLRGRPRLTSLSVSYAAHGFAAAPFGRLAGDRKLHQLSAHCPARCSGAASVWHTILPSYWRRRTAVFSRHDNEAVKRGEGSWNVALSAHCPARCSGAASVWHTILPSYWRRRTAVFSRHDNEAVKRGEGSWNVAWDARPARWLQHPDSAWFLFGVFGAAPFIDPDLESKSEVLIDESSNSDKYRVTGVAADGRCLFRAIAHMACLINGEKAPDENRQRELADELRSQVVEELLSRRKEIEWFIDEEFDVYVKRIEQPYTWGGEPELLMCAHVLRTPVCVYMKEKSSGSLIKTTYYGEEYRREDRNPINVLFHGYGHYDILEAIGSS